MSIVLIESLINFLVLYSYLSKTDAKIFRGFYAKFTLLARDSRLVKLSACIARFTETPLHECITKCIMVSTCSSLNFKVNHLTCELLSISKFHEVGLIVPQEGWTHYETDVTEKNNGPLCDLQSSCKEYQVCEDNFIRPGYICKCPTWFNGTECEEYAGPGSTSDNRAASCVLLQEQFKTIREGYYWIKGSSKTVLCHGLVDGAWSQWNSWQKCDITCGKGFQRRSRSCDEPQPKLGGKDCEGKSIEVKECILDECKLENIALFKPSFQSSTFLQKSSALGNDGKMDTYTMTNIDKSAQHWWEVNLGKAAKISSIHIVMTQSYQKRILIETKTKGNSRVLCKELDAPEKVNKITCEKPTTAQYLRVTETSDIGYLDLTEFQVFGTFL